MATNDENPFAKWDLPPDPVVDENADNPFAEFIKAPNTPAAAAAVPAARARTALESEVPLAGDDPRNAPLYDPDIERAKKGILPHATLEDYLPNGVLPGAAKPYIDETIRAGAKAVSAAPFLPIDAAVGVRNFINAGQYNPQAFTRALNPLAGGTLAPGDYASPSQRLEDILNQHTQAPTTTSGRVAEAINSALLGAKLPTGFPAPAPRPMVNPTRADLALATAEKEKVPFYFDDWSRNPFAKKLGIAAENVPVVGTASGRAEQAEAALNAAQRRTGRLAADIDSDLPFANVLQQSMQRRLQAFRGAADVLYNRAGALLDPAGTVPTSRFDSAIHHELARQEALGSAADPAVVDILTRFDNAPRGNFSLMRNLRSQLKGAISSFYNGNKAIGDRGVDRLIEAREALEADMGDFARKVGGAAEKAWSDADQFYKTNLVPFKEAGFRQLAKTGEPEKLWTYLTAEGGKESRAGRMYNSLDSQGRAAVRAGMFQEAMNSALGPKGTFSPARFAGYLENHENIINQFFHGNELQEVRGFTNLMRHVDRAGQYMENPPTGNRLIGWLMVGAPATGKIGTAAVASTAGIAGGIRTLFQTKTGRDLLISASKLKPGSPAMGAISDQLRNVIARSVITTPPSESEPEPTPEE